MSYGSHFLAINGSQHARLRAECADAEYFGIAYLKKVRGFESADWREDGEGVGKWDPERKAWPLACLVYAFVWP